LLNFLAFVSFFPQLVAGPISRAKQLLPQFEGTRVITREHLAEGIWLSLWGMFKKVVLADNFAPLVDMVFQNPTHSGPAIALGTFAFACQIYCDFSGYSDIARGTAKILGFDLVFNFRIPYAAANVREFWQRWHISLSTWLRDYLYISLGGNRGGEFRTYRNLLLTMVIGGLWHGAAWNFVLWGLWHGCGLVVHRMFSQRRAPSRSISVRVGAWFLTMLFILYSWLLFRAHSLDQIIAFTRSFADPSVPVWFNAYCINLAAFLLPLLLMEIWLERANNLLAPLLLPRWQQAALQGTLLIAIAFYWGREASPFIYFQF
jgi:D-alanyl-lipoteichoic acid acyltransferase DltB (MBOAT superfamily)